MDKKYIPNGLRGKHKRPQTNFYNIINDITELTIKSKTYGDIVFIIDTDKVERIKKYHWTLRKLYNNYYAYANFWKGKSIALHRYIMECPEKLVIDHIDRNTLNNRKNNLRICNQLVNVKNRPTNKVGHRGIVLNSAGNYRVRLQINKIKFNKTFDNLESAIKYRNELEEKYHKKEEIICDI